MRTKVLFILLLWGAAAGAELLACGNKFLVASRGTRFGKVAIARQEAAILVYANPVSNLGEALGGVPVEAVLTQAGYLPTVVDDPAEYERALGQGGWDLVLADLGDTAALRDRFQGDEAPVVMPVVYAPTRSELAQAKKEYGRVLKAPFKSQRLLQTIDDAVAARAR